MAVRVMLAFALSLLLSACAVDGGGGTRGIPLGALAGDWVGWFEDVNGADYDLTLTVDGFGRVTEVFINGSLQPFTGVLFNRTAESFGISYSDRSSATLAVDPLARYGVYFDPTGGFAVLQRNPTFFTRFNFNDPVGRWTGSAYIYDPGAGEFLKYAPWDIDITDQGAVMPIAGIDEAGNLFAGGLTAHNGTFGWYGGYLNSPINLDLLGGLSADKQFFGAYVGRYGTDIWPRDFWFLVMERP